MLKRLLKILNSLLSFTVITVLLLCCTYAGYALWDNSRIYKQADDVQADLIKLKPNVDDPEGPSFGELLLLNKDVCGWLTVDNTKIDYPVVQGENNLTYINMDVYGNFALAGSIYLDSRNARDFTDKYSVLYGHHMENGRMFGDLELFKDASFFNANGSGILLVPGTSYDLEIFACLMVGASEDNIFEPETWLADINPLLDYAQQSALHKKQNIIDEIRTSENPRILAMTTCATDFTDARTIVLAVMHPRSSGVLN